MKITGIFDLSHWQENTDSELSAGCKLTTAEVKQSYQGHLAGESDLTYKMFYRDENEVFFCGFEVFEGQLEGTHCQLVLQHTGRFQQGIATSQFTIIGSDTHSELVGNVGEFSAKAGGQGCYSIG